jgi:hypothetical protein
MGALITIASFDKVLCFDRIKVEGEALVKIVAQKNRRGTI